MSVGPGKTHYRQGQQLTLFSDGVVEARNHHAEHVADTAVTFGQDDDITVLTVTRLAPA